MFVFSSLQAAIQAGFRWSTFWAAEQLHIVEMERTDVRGRRVKALAFARPAPEQPEII